MRITTKMMTSNFQRNLNNNLVNMQQLYNQVNTGKLISKPSDNPFLATRIMDYNTEITRKEQFERNLDDVKGFMDMTDTVAGQVTDQMNRIKELTTKASSGTNSASDLAIIATEVDEIMATMVDTLNTSFEDKYIFGGTETSQKPFELVNGNITYQGNEEKTKVEIAKGVYIDRNITGTEILGGITVTGEAQSYNLFDSLNSISEALKNNDQAKLTSLTSHVDDHLDNILKVRGKVGAVQQRIDLTIDKTKDEILNLTELLSSKEDADLAEKYIEYTSLQTSYMASLQISSQIIQPSLLDFLK